MSKRKENIANIVIALFAAVVFVILLIATMLNNIHPATWEKAPEWIQATLTLGLVISLLLSVLFILRQFLLVEEEEFNKLIALEEKSCPLKKS